MTAERLILGTAQFGLDYGIHNRSGRPDDEEIQAMVASAWSGGLRMFDTAQGYGDAESRLGRAIEYLGLAQEACVITKFSLSPDLSDLGRLPSRIERSRDRLKVPSLYGCLLHDESLLDVFHDGLRDTLQELKRKGMILHVGVSCYSPKRAIQAVQVPEMDLIQIPANLFDRRFEAAGVFDLARKRRKRICIRSVFLQGLLLMKTDDLPGSMKFAAPIVEKWEQTTKTLKIRPDVLALQYVKSRYPEAFIVFGAENRHQVLANLSNWSETVPPDIVDRASSSFSIINDRLLNPSQWNASTR